MRLHLSKRQVLVSVGVLTMVLLAVGTGALLFWLQHKDQPTGNTQQGPASDSNRLPAKIDEIQNLAVSGDVAQSNQKIQEALSQPNVPDQEKYDLYVQQGVNYSNTGQHAQALAAFKQAEAAKKDSNIEQLLGGEAEALGDKQAAINYYKETLKLLDKSSAGYNGDKEVFENKVKSLGGTL